VDMATNKLEPEELHYFFYFFGIHSTPFDVLHVKFGTEIVFLVSARRLQTTAYIIGNPFKTAIGSFFYLIITVTQTYFKCTQ